MGKILVTGATGHIGNVLVRALLAKGRQVRALIWRGEDTTPLEGLEVEQVEGDVLDLDSLAPAFKDIDKVYHLAGLISIMPGKQDLVQRVNLGGTRNMLQCARQFGVQRFVYTSSIHALEHAPQGVLIDENLSFDPVNTLGAYDCSKAAASLAVKEAAQQGLDAVLVCPTGVIGPYDYRRSEIGEVIRTAAEQKPQLYVEGAYDFVDVRDVAQGMILAEEKGRSGESYILSGERISVRYLLETIREITGKGFFSLKVPTSLAHFVTRFTPTYYRLTKSKPRITPYSLEVLNSNCHISHEKATRELGYKPRSLRESLTDTVAWFLENYRRRTSPKSA